MSRNPLHEDDDGFLAFEIDRFVFVAYGLALYKPVRGSISDAVVQGGSTGRRSLGCEDSSLSCNLFSLLIRLF